MFGTQGLKWPKQLLMTGSSELTWMGHFQMDALYLRWQHLEWQWNYICVADIKSGQRTQQQASGDWQANGYRCMIGVIRKLQMERMLVYKKRKPFTKTKDPKAKRLELDMWATLALNSRRSEWNNKPFFSDLNFQKVICESTIILRFLNIKRNRCNLININSAK